MSDRRQPGEAGRAGVVGRRRELDSLSALFEPDGPTVAHVHGLPGIGKTTLLRELVAQARARGIKAQMLDCRAIEPTEQGFRDALAELSLPESALAGIRGLLCLDNYESFLLLDAWFRNRWLPETGGAIRLVMSGRRQPNPAWLGADALFLSLRLRELDAEDARMLLARAGLGDANARRVWGFAGGHPLAMRLAVAAVHNHQGEPPEDLALHEVVSQLTGFFLDDVSDAETRQALEAASTVRRVTRPLLASMLPEADGEALYQSLAKMSLVETRRDGLSLHAAVHESVAQHLRSADPARFVAYRRAAWRALQEASADVAAGDLWRYTADIIYLIDNPIVREAFFPSGSQSLSVECAGPEDRAVVMAITERHDGVDGRAVMEHWWRALPTAFHVARDLDREVVGFYCLFDPAEAPGEALAGDPMTRAWVDDLPTDLVGQPRRALFLRRWLGAEQGEVPSPIQAACWLDVKRTYLEFRPQLQRVYLAVADLAPYASAATQLGFVVVCGERDLPQASAMLDFGPGSVDAWLRRLVRHELGLQDEVSLDEGARALLLGAERIELTQLEFGLMRLLVRAAGDAVGRDRILAEVWGDKQEAVGSNVVDVVVRGLRKKLGAQSGAIGTVRGVGYRFRA